MKRGDRGSSRTAGRIERGGGDGGEPAGAHKARVRFRWPNAAIFWYASCWWLHSPQRGRTLGNFLKVTLAQDAGWRN